MFFEALVRHARRAVVFVIGGTVVLLGVVMVIGPGPGVVTVAAGLGILAIEFAWAKRLLDRAKVVAGEQTERYAPPWVKRLLEKIKGVARRRKDRVADKTGAQGAPDGGSGDAGKSGDGARKKEEES